MLCVGQKKIDSTYVADYFTKIQLLPNSDSLTSEIKKLENQSPRNALEHFYYHYSKYLIQHGAIEKSKKYSNRGIALFKSDTTNFKIVKFFNLIAAAYSMQKDYPAAVALFNKSIALAEKNKEHKQVAYLNNNLTNIFFSLQDYKSAYKYGSRAWSYLKYKKDDPFRQQMLAILSVAEAKIGKIKEAEYHANDALSISLKTNDALSIVVSKYALGEILVLKMDFEGASKMFEESGALSDSTRNYQLSMLNSIGLLHCYNELKKYDLATKQGEKGLAIAAALQNDNTIYSIKKNLAISYNASGNFKKAFQYMADAHKIFQETTSSEAQKKVNDILIKYDTEKKEKELFKQNNEILEKDAKNGRFLQIITWLIFGLVVVLFFLFYLRSKSRQKAIQLAIESEKNALNALMKGEEEERLRIANELHDGLASNLTAARFKLENIEINHTVQKSELLELLRSTHEETRRIAHNLSPLAIEKYGFLGSLNLLSEEYSSKKCKVKCFVTGDVNLIPTEKALVFYRITQELVQNALKHADATEIEINLFCEAEEVRLMAEDNGKGFDVQETTKKGGLSNLQKRIENLKGTLEIDSMPNRGTVIHISIPNNK